VKHLPRSLPDPPEAEDVTAPPGVIDAHVHVFPAPLFAAIRRWFDEHAWDIRYRIAPDEVDGYLTARGVERYLALHYAHKPGIAEGLNGFVLDYAARHPRCIPCATVFPGEPDARGILGRALTAGARAIKIHAHVQCVAPDDTRLDDVYATAIAHDALLVFHCGDEPDSAAYKCDVKELCTVDRLARALARFPDLKIVVPHLGSGDLEGMERLLDRHAGLYLDTAMTLAGYFPDDRGAALVRRRPERVLFGTDFPNIPYAWERDLRGVLELGLTDPLRAGVLGGNARRLLGV
jgi:uncharacterized protein